MATASRTTINPLARLRAPQVRVRMGRRGIVGDSDDDRGPAQPRQDAFGNELLPVLTADQLLEDRNRQAILRQIRRLASTTDHGFETTYLALVRSFAEFVQQLPASEAHHHAYPGGLLDHALEVATHALRVRRQHILPRGAPPETAARVADVWTVAVFAAALFHDVAKPVTDQRVELHSPQGGRTLWNPWVGPMPSGLSYRISFNARRDYADHDAAAAFVARRLIPTAVLDYLARDPTALLSAIGSLNRHAGMAGVIGEIVATGDGASAAKALGASAQTVPSAKRMPLSLAFKKCVRQLIETGDIPLNRPGAGGFSDASDLWLVSKRTLDQVRPHLEEAGVPLPPTNFMLMTDLLATRVLVAHGEDGKKATVRAAVTIGEWSTTLNFIHMRITDLFDEGAAPDPIDGEVAPEEDAADPPPQAPTCEDPVPAVAESKPAMPEPPAELGEEPTTSGPDAADPPSSTPPPTPSPRFTPMEEYPDVLEHERKLAASKAARIDPAPDPGSRSAAAVDDPEEGDPDDDGVREDPRPDSEPEGFVWWLKKGLRDGTLSFNHKKAQLHGVPEGLLIVSPKTFNEYEAVSGTFWKTVQQAFVGARYAYQTASGGNVFRYKITKKNQNGRHSMIQGILVGEPSEVGITVPGLNDLLELNGDPPRPKQNTKRKRRKAATATEPSEVEREADAASGADDEADTAPKDEG